MERKSWTFPLNRMMLGLVRLGKPRIGHFGFSWMLDKMGQFITEQKEIRSREEEKKKESMF